MGLSLKEDSEKAGALSGSCFCVTIIIYFNCAMYIVKSLHITIRKFTGMEKEDEKI